MLAGTSSTGLAAVSTALQKVVLRSSRASWSTAEVTGVGTTSIFHAVHGWNSSSVERGAASADFGTAKERPRTVLAPEKRAVLAGTVWPCRAGCAALHRPSRVSQKPGDRPCWVAALEPLSSSASLPRRPARGCWRGQSRELLPAGVTAFPGAAARGAAPPRRPKAGYCLGIIFCYYKLKLYAVRGPE